MKNIGNFKSKKIYYCRLCGIKFFKTDVSKNKGNYCSLKCYYKSHVEKNHCIICGENITNKIHNYIDKNWDNIIKWDWKKFNYVVNILMIKHFYLCDNCLYNASMIGIHTSAMRRRRIKYYNKNLTES